MNSQESMPPKNRLARVGKILVYPFVVIAIVAALLVFQAVIGFIGAVGVLVGVLCVFLLIPFYVYSWWKQRREAHRLSKDQRRQINRNVDP